MFAPIQAALRHGVEPISINESGGSDVPDILSRTIRMDYRAGIGRWSNEMRELSLILVITLLVGAASGCRRHPGNAATLPDTEAANAAVARLARQARIRLPARVGQHRRPARPETRHQQRRQRNHQRHRASALDASCGGPVHTGWPARPVRTDPGRPGPDWR